MLRPNGGDYAINSFLVILLLNKSHKKEAEATIWPKLICHRLSPRRRNIINSRSKRFWLSQSRQWVRACDPWPMTYPSLMTHLTRWLTVSCGCSNYTLYLQIDSVGRWYKLFSIATRYAQVFAESILKPWNGLPAKLHNFSSLSVFKSFMFSLLLIRLNL